MAFLTSSLATIGANVHHNNPIAAGVANTISTVAPWFEFVPFTPIDGRTLTRQYQVDADLTKFTDESTDLSADATTSAQITSTAHTFEIKSVVGQAQVGQLNSAGASANGVDLMAIAVEGKARDIARKVYKQVVTGKTNGDASGFEGLGDDLVGSGNLLGSSNDATADTDILTILDETLDGVTAKDGQVDWIMMNATVMNKFRAKARSLNAFEYITTPISNRNILAYQGIPIFRNDYIPMSGGGANTESYVYAGSFEDGTGNGVAMLYPSTVPGGIITEDLGVSERYLANLTRVVQHTAFGVLNTKGIRASLLDTAVLV
jgi:hypothetical protein